MSQPFNRGMRVPAPGELDNELNEFWVSNPWDISDHHNLSAYERNRTFLNVAGKSFVDISHITGTDSDGDGRSVVGADLNHDGRVELLVRQAGGGPLFIYENLFPQKNWLKVTLEGTKSNTQGMGARLEARHGDVTLRRAMNPVNTFRSQAPCLVHFGLEDSEVVSQLVVEWPSGQKQVIRDIEANQHIVVREGEDGFRVMGAE